MFRKILLTIAMLLVLAALTGLYLFKMSKTNFKGDSKILYIHTNSATRDAVLETLKKDSIGGIKAFDLLADYMGYWKNIKPGRYRVKAGTDVTDLLRQLRNGIQTPVDLVISRKIRLRQDFARMIGNNFETDSAAMMRFLTSDDSLSQFKLDSATWISAIIENTYSIPWTWPPGKIFRKLFNDRETFWNKSARKEKAKQLGYTPEEIYTIASIVTEESNKDVDRLNIASVYLNRLRIGMRLQADPTVKYAMKNFMLKRILYTHLSIPSPYNTYVNGGLPPGPICTVSGKTIDQVLDAPKTDYLYFVANADLYGGSSFSSTLSSHQKLARLYQDSLTAFLQRKLLKEQKKRDSIFDALKK